MISETNHNLDLPGYCEYLDIRNFDNILMPLYEQVRSNEYNEFGKTGWHSYSLEHIDGRDTGFTKIFQPILDIMKQVHPHMQKRSTGFNTSNAIDNNLFIHTDIDTDQEHPNYYNIIIPLLGESTISYYKSAENEIFLGEPNAQGHGYYHEFKHHNSHDHYSDFVNERRIGSVNMNKPVLLSTNTMHGVTVQQAPRVAWCTRWINIPQEVDFNTFKTRVEEVLS